MGFFKVLLVILYFYISVFPLFADTSSSKGVTESKSSISNRRWISPEEEAPPALFEANIGDTNISFFTAGSWESRLEFVTGLILRPGFPVSWLDSFPNESIGFLYENNPDITLSVRMMDRYFLEVSVLKDFDKNSILMGYEGKEEEPIRYLYIGNRDISMDPLPFIDIPDSGSSSIGSVISFRSGELAEHNLLIRYDLQEKQEKLFIGKNELEEKRIDIGDYIRGKYFFLPDSNVDELRVYVRDPNGVFTASDSYRYRLLSTTEYVFNNERGELYVRSEIGERLVVYYVKGGSEIGDPSLGKGALPGTNGENYDLSLSPTDFRWGINYMGIDTDELSLTIEGKKSLILWNRGEFSPFEICNRYSLGESLPSDLSNIQVEVCKKGGEGSDLEGSNFYFLIDGDTGVVSVVSREGGFKDYYPFFDYTPEIYGPNAFLNRTSSDYELEVRILNPVSDFSVGGDVIPGSLHVEVNGIEETRFKIDYDTGKIEFLFDVKPTDRIRIVYRREAVTPSGGDLLFVWGNRIKLNDLLLLDVSGGVRWNLLPGRYAIKDGDKTGAVVSSIGVSMDGEDLSFDASMAVGYSNANTTGILRVEGMDTQNLNVVLSENSIFPASTPIQDELAPFGVDDIYRSTRGFLFYKNYRVYGPMDSVSLIYYGDSIPDSNIYPYRDGSKCGPYIAGGSSLGRIGKSMVLDYSIPNGKRWVGALIPLPDTMGGEDGTGMDYSTVRSVSVSLKGYRIDGDVEVIFQIGRVGEDLDGDGVLDSEDSKFSRGFDFNDISNSATLLVGGGPKGEGNFVRDSEDFNRNGFLDSEEANYVVSFSTEISGDTEWKNITYTFSDREREKLIGARSLRILIVKKTDGAVNGVILIDKINLNGCSFTVNSGGGNVYVDEVEDRGELIKYFPELENIIIADSGGEQMFLRIKWDSVSIDEGFSVKKYLANRIGENSYGNLEFFIKSPSDSGSGSFSLELLDYAGKGIHVTIDMESLCDTEGVWHRIDVDLSKESVFIDGKYEKNGRVTIDSDFESLSMLKLTVNGTESGSIYLDEILLKNSRGRFGIAFKGDFKYHDSKTILEIGDIPLLSNFCVNESLYLSSPGFSTLYGESLSSFVYSSRSVSGINLLGNRLELNLGLTGQNENMVISVGHRLSWNKWNLPIIIPVTLKDEYSETSAFDIGDGKYEGINLFKYSRVNLRLFNSVNSFADFTSKLSSLNLFREWKGGLTFNSGGIFNSTIETSLARREDDYGFNYGTYINNWIHSFNFIFPWVFALERERWVSYGSGLNLQFLRLKNLNISGRTSVKLKRYLYNFVESSEDIRDTYLLSFSLPCRIGNDFNVEPTYKRELTITTTGEYYSSFWDDTLYLGENFSESRYLYQSVPLVELFDNDLARIVVGMGDGMDIIDYLPEVSLSLTRKFGSYIYDLFLPSFFSIGLKREVKKEYSTVSEKWSGYLNLKSNAINLFGSLGAYSLFKFYRTDEFVSSLKLNINYPSGNSESYTIDNLNYVNFAGKEREYTIQNSLSLSSALLGGPDTIKNVFLFSFKWKSSESLGILDSFFSEEWLKLRFLENEEQFRYIYLSRDSGDTFVPLTISVEHWTRLRVKGKGFIGFNVASGVSYEAPLDSLKSGVYRILLKLGLNAKITF